MSFSWWSPCFCSFEKHSRWRPCRMPPSKIQNISGMIRCMSRLLHTNFDFSCLLPKWLRLLNKHFLFYLTPFFFYFNLEWIYRSSVIKELICMAVDKIKKGVIYRNHREHKRGCMLERAHCKRLQQAFTIFLPNIYPNIGTSSNMQYLSTVPPDW